MLIHGPIHIMLVALYWSNYGAGHTKMEAFWCEMYSPSGCSIAIESENLTIICLDCFFSLHARGGRLREPCAIGGKAFCKACLN